MKRIDYFLLMFPPEHLVKIAKAKSARLKARSLRETTVGEILRFLGVIFLMTRIGFAERQSLWSAKKPSKRKQHVNLSDDMSRQRFEELLANIAFSGEQNSSGTIAVLKLSRLSKQSMITIVPW